MNEIIFFALFQTNMGHNYLRPPQKMGAQRCGRLAITSPRGETLLTKVVRYYITNKNVPRGVGQSFLQLELFTHLVLRPWFRMEVKTHCQKWLTARFFGSARCMGFLESWVLGSMWFWCHCYLYQNGVLTFGPSSWGTGDL